MAEVLDGPTPRVYGLPPGADFGAELVAGLAHRLDGHPPEAWAATTLIVPTRRMARRLREVLDAGPPRLLPRIRQVADLALDPAGAGLPPPVSALRRRLELAQLLRALIAREPDMAPPARAWDLADSLAALMEEMHGEGVPPERLAKLDVSDLSGHWERSLRFLQLLAPWFAEGGEPDAEARLRLVATRLGESWARTPPAGPMILAGSTGSRGATRLLMEAVARLPEGAVILPGHDFDLPEATWDQLDDPLTGEDHPQFRAARFLWEMGMRPGDVRAWTGRAGPAPARARLVSLALRPPPVTDQWLAEGPSLGCLVAATDGVTLLEAPSPRLEAETVALRLRAAVEAGVTAALVTPDRTMARRVAAALDRWGLVPDDSAGTPLSLSPPGRLLRQVAHLRGERVTGESLLALLKHPLCNARARGGHLAHAHALELSLRRRGPAFPDGAALLAWGRRHAEAPGRQSWAAWLATLLDRLRHAGGEAPLGRHLQDHVATAEALVGGEGGDGAELWAEAAGREARALLLDLGRHADAGGTVTARDHAHLLDGLMARTEVRERDRGHPGLLVWGTQEARAGGAGLVVLGSLNEGAWPAATAPDPWLNRRLRAQAGLLLPERQVGLAAHEFQSACGAPEVWLTRAVRSEDAPTVPSRWLNRLANLLGGLKDQRGPEALDLMRARARGWLEAAEGLTRPPAPVAPARRPSPRPPPQARPTRLSVTEIETLLRDPYAVYARRILGLDALPPLTAQADAPARGVALHAILERFMAAHDPEDAGARDALLAVARAVLDESCPWPVVRALWAAQVERFADGLLADERTTRAGALRCHLELQGEVEVPGTGVRLVGKADRIDVLPDGSVAILDYKSGEVPSGAEQEHFARQALLLAAMARAGAFADLGVVEVSRAAFVGLGAKVGETPAPLAKVSPDQAWADLATLLRSFADASRGYTSRAAPRKERHEGRYDHLARFGEWDHTEHPHPEDLGE
mgnify:CR=1 FL=1